MTCTVVLCSTRSTGLIDVSTRCPSAATSKSACPMLALMRASVVEINKLERHIPYLATTASVTPFIGLFGTVVGIMMAFQGIAQQGSTNLAVVSRPIAEALIATAFIRPLSPLVIASALM